MTARAHGAVSAAALLLSLVLLGPPTADRGPAAVARESPVGAAVEEPEVHALRGEQVAVFNLAGDVEIRRGSGAEVRVEVRRGGEDRGRLSVATGEVDDRQALRVLYPADDVVYPEHRGRTTLRVRDDGTFGRGGGGDRVRITGDGPGLRAHADLVIEVPEGRDVDIRLGAGRLASRGVSGELALDVTAGSITVGGHRGTLGVDTGSGSIEVADVEGDLVADTGSGSIRAAGVRGERIALDTGSGGVRGGDLAGRELEVDTGSGSITRDAVTARETTLDTGSGSVRLTLVADVERLEIDTGSGSVDLAVPPSFGSRIDVETGSGRMTVARAVGAEILERAEYRFFADRLPVSKRPVVVVRERKDDDGRDDTLEADTLMLVLDDGTSLRDAEELADRLNDRIDRVTAVETQG